MNMPFVSPPFEIPRQRPTLDGYAGHREIRKIRRGILRHSTIVYMVKLSSDFPLMLHHTNGRTYKPHDSRFESDGGSVPSLVQTLRLPYVNLKRDSWLQSFFIHDNACDRGGCDVWTATGWQFQKLTRAAIDRLLLEAMMAEGANVTERSMIYGAVRAFAHARGLLARFKR